MIDTVVNSFFDPVLRGPFFGAACICSFTAMIGVLVFLKRESLIGEMISHTCYPGVLLGLISASIFLPEDSWQFVFLLLGASLSAFLSLTLFKVLKNRAISSDTALCLCMACFFGAGLLLASSVQRSSPAVYRKSLSFLFGQAATLSDSHLIFYATLLALFALFLFLDTRRIEAFIFDPPFSKLNALSYTFLENGYLVLLTFACVIALRSVGVVLLSAMFVAPAVFARAFAKNIRQMFVLAGFSGFVCAYFGSLISHNLTKYYSLPDSKVVFPTGPSIVLLASAFALMALLIAPQQGFIVQKLKRLRFKFKVSQENILKKLWKESSPQTSQELIEFLGDTPLWTKLILYSLKKAHLLIKTESGLSLTETGRLKAAQVVRLHRLWELYLVRCVGLQKERVHANAEEMEHVITSDMEKTLVDLLENPSLDPHHQPIPKP